MGVTGDGEKLIMGMLLGFTENVQVDYTPV
jgi:hypothetical protein